jgi:hypothetical protein
MLTAKRFRAQVADCVHCLVDDLHTKIDLHVEHKKMGKAQEQLL